jgi:hypothetical protein
MERPWSAGSELLLRPPKLSSAAPPNRATGATIAFLESDRPEGPRASDAYGDEGGASAATADKRLAMDAIVVIGAGRCASRTRTGSTTGGATNAPQPRSSSPEPRALAGAF